ncbi:ferritin-like domain-containing protein [Rhizobium helianthi]|uniref:Ferritin-like domain-containing protein n=1 Tax=Rhizobium helianthi TaxID=1132695 RepID=A0ABW4M6G8_9HYPH
MTHAKDHFAKWLSDAHALELQSIALLKSQIARIENYPDLREKMIEHLANSEGHEKALRGLMERFPGAQSLIKDVAGRLSATAQGLTGAFSADEIVRTCMNAYVFAHEEVARYKVLLAAADELGDSTAVAVCERILSEEKAMADWLELYLDGVTRLYLMRDERDLLAKR